MGWRKFLKLDLILVIPAIILGSVFITSITFLLANFVVAGIVGLVLMLGLIIRLTALVMVLLQTIMASRLYFDLMLFSFCAF